MPSRWDSFGIIVNNSTDMPPLTGLVDESELSDDQGSHDEPREESSFGMRFG